MSTRFMLAFALIFLACGGKEDDEGPTCGDASCADDEFCLTEQMDGEEAEVCAALPDGCEDADHMCFGDPDVCVEDWSEVVCPDAIGTGCIGTGDEVLVLCDDGSGTTSR